MYIILYKYQIWCVTNGVQNNFSVFINSFQRSETKYSYYFLFDQGIQLRIPVSWWSRPTAVCLFVAIVQDIFAGSCRHHATKIKFSTCFLLCLYLIFRVGQGKVFQIINSRFVESHTQWGLFKLHVNAQEFIFQLS